MLGFDILGINNTHGIFRALNQKVGLPGNKRENLLGNAGRFQMTIIIIINDLGNENIFRGRGQNANSNGAQAPCTMSAIERETRFMVVVTRGISASCRKKQDQIESVFVNPDTQLRKAKLQSELDTTPSNFTKIDAAPMT